MKKILLFIFSAILISSCDFVTNPVENVTPDPGDTTTGFVQRKVLIEDFTGHKCAACPPAAVELKNILAANPSKVVGIAVHPNSVVFNKPASSGTSYLTDFRTTAGTAYDAIFGVTIKGLPNGLINRKNFTGTNQNHIFPHKDWAAEVFAESAKPANVKIEIVNTYNSLTKQLECKVTSTFLQDTLTGLDYYLVVSLIEDSIVATQLSGSLIIPNYIHQHVLRDNLNGTWGQKIATYPVTKNSPIVEIYNYTLPSTYPSTGGINSSPCVPKHCHIVAYIYNGATKEVIQVEEKHVTH